MNFIVKSLLGALLVYGLTGCGSSSGSSSSPTTQPVVVTSNGSAAAAPLGNVMLENALAVDAQSTSPRVSVQVASNPGALGYQSRTRDEFRLEHSFEGTFMNLGCDLSRRADEVRGLLQRPFPEANGSAVNSAQAEVLFVCNLAALKSANTNLLAERLVLQGAHMVLEGDSDHQLSIRVRQIELEGQSEIDLIGRERDGVVDFSKAPGLEVSADQISGDGHLLIETSLQTDHQGFKLPSR